jgi:hypothetical protein
LYFSALPVIDAWWPLLFCYPCSFPP